MPQLLRVLLLFLVCIGLVGNTLRSEADCCAGENEVADVGEPGSADADDDCATNCFADCGCCHVAAGVAALPTGLVHAESRPQHHAEAQRPPPPTHPEGPCQVPIRA